MEGRGAGGAGERRNLISDFEVRREDRGEVSILHLKGLLDAPTAPRLEEALRRLLGEGRSRVVVNFRELSYIGSAGIGVFLEFLEESRRRGGDIKLSNLSPRVRAVFELLGFPKLIELYGQEEEAVGQFLGG
jgi:anti-sigma B factor antagonist